jgi:hypothetical protein
MATEDNVDLVTLLKERITLDQKLQLALERRPAMMPSYRRGEKGWKIAWIRWGEYCEIELALDPPGDEWSFATTDRLQTLQTQLGCNRVHALATKEGEIRYIAEWDAVKGAR